jgi:hypothetical protein
MSNRLAVVLNGESQVEYDRDKPLPPPHQQFLDRMDQQMDAGITLGDAVIAQPNELERAQFVALLLIEAIDASDERGAAAMLAYLANRIPGMRQLRADKHGDDVTIDFVFDEDYVKAVKVQFVGRGSAGGSGPSLH